MKIREMADLYDDCLWRAFELLDRMAVLLQRVLQEEVTKDVRVHPGHKYQTTGLVILVGGDEHHRSGPISIESLLRRLGLEIRVWGQLYISNEEAGRIWRRLEEADYDEHKGRWR